MKRATYRHVEAEIYAYYDTLKAIEELRKDIILAGGQDELGAVVGGGYASSKVERRATKLADSILLREMERITRAIADVYTKTKEEVRHAIWVKYGLAIDWQPPEELVAKMKGRNRFDMSVREMADMIPVAESTFYAYRTGFVYGVAERLGWY
ncbi:MULTISPECIES: hypothetical protein [Carboxydocella]|nr:MULTISPECIES: hypothetical protein [Carboxydocella]